MMLMLGLVLQSTGCFLVVGAAGGAGGTVYAWAS